MASMNEDLPVPFMPQATTRRVGDASSTRSSENGLKFVASTERMNTVRAYESGRTVRHHSWRRGASAHARAALDGTLRGIQHDRLEPRMSMQLDRHSVSTGRCP
jgi:hypothetical protein